MKIGPAALEDIALGATVLGTGGGGDPHVGKLVARQAIEECGHVKMLQPSELDDDAFVLVSAQMGAPTVAVEKLPGGPEPISSVERVEAEFGRAADAIMPMECGGINSTFPFAVAARKGIPLVDADGMGRAFPELQHETFNVYGVSGTPAAVSDEHGNTCLLDTNDNEQLEWLARGVTIRMGGVAYVTDYPMSGTEVKETAIPGTMTLARSIGRAVQTADGSTVAAIREATHDSIYGTPQSLFEGKIVDVKRRTEGGFVVGSVMVDGLDSDDDRTMEVKFQNENLGARIDDKWVATVPDLITILDRETGDPIRTEALRYGGRVEVLGIPTPEIMRTDAALGVWGPKTFGIDTQFVPLEQ
ncbi:DUF917 domain-containing protein [Halococcus sediminicola]|uniref:DUF917 domain-containing protein n=1 Tax=Halococcus sediminicola TaxID=1264579 RepID=UPI0006791D1D|nr:DUF917 domain-containing protein [Halococcus sediminicola]